MLGAATLVGEGAHEELPPVQVALQPGTLLRGGELRELRPRLVRVRVRVRVRGVCELLGARVRGRGSGARLVVDEVRVEDLEQLLVGRLARA